MAHTNLESQVAVITGGTKNIGLAIATHFLKKGWAVMVLSRSRSPVEQLLRAAAELPGRLKLFRADVTDPMEVKKAAAQIEQLHGRTDLLVNNAGGLCIQEPLRETDPAWFKAVFDLNICGVFNTCHAFGESIIRSRGKIINLSGGGATAATEDGWNLAYSSAKAAVLRFTEALANQLKPQGVEVYAIDPGWVPSPEELQEIQSNQSQGRVDLSYIRSASNTPELIDYLLANGAPSISGKLVSVLDDYRAIINRLSAEPNPDSLKLRLAGF